MKKILLLNPPAEKRILRLIICSCESKGRYLDPPADLLWLSSHFRKYDVSFLDCIANNISKEKALFYINENKYDIIFSMVASILFESDINFLKEIKRSNASIMLSVMGDMFFEDPACFLYKYAFIDNIILNPLDSSILDLVENRSVTSKYIITRESEEKSVLTNYKLGYTEDVPMHEIFVNNNYNFPFVKYKRFATSMISYGCPYKCTFCTVHQAPYITRTKETIFKELVYINEMKIKELRFNDPSFGKPRKLVVDVLDFMVENKFNFSFSLSSRVDILDYELLALLKKAGCHTIIFGVESSDDSILKKYKKGFTTSDVSETFANCKKLKIKTVGTFILGFPEDTYESCLRTIEYAINLDCDFASFNIAAPRPLTELRDILVRANKIDGSAYSFNSTSEICDSIKLNRKELVRIRNLANKKFYLRVPYILKRIKNIRTLSQFATEILEGFALVKGIYKNNVD